MPEGGVIIALVGAESTGKSTLAAALHRQLRTDLDCVLVGEYLREWCEARGRTPRPEEQAEIAQEQQQRIELAARAHALVLCDTTPLMTAVYSDYLFDDRSLHAEALAFQRRCAISLLSALDLPWRPDGLQRDGPHVRRPVDARLRHALLDAGLPWSVIGGQGPARLEAALDALTPVLMPLMAQPSDASGPRRPGLFTRLAQRQAAQPVWQWSCEQCDVPECEHLSLLRKD
jgi:nicotinamide riboside kinase